MLPILLAATQFAPFLAKYLNGGDTSEKIANGVAEVAKVVTGAVSPEQAITLLQQSSELQQKFSLAVMDKQIEWDSIYLADIKDARDRDIKLNAAGFKNKRANWLVGFVIFSVIALMAVVIVMSDLDEWRKGVLLVALGRMWGYLDQIMNFDFGTTRSSKQKDETIASMAKDK